MKKLFLTLVMFLGAILFVVQGSAQATSYTFDDNTIYWGSSQSWTDSEKWTNANGAGDDMNDSIGYPSITAGTIVINDRKLTEVNFNYEYYISAIIGPPTCVPIGVPEPMPLLLLGLSLLGLGITSGKKFLAKK